MHSKQLFFLTTLLTVYLGRVLMGEAIHLAACSYSHDFGDAHPSCLNHCVSHQSSSHRACHPPVPDRDTIPDSDNNNHQHDSDDCSVCLVFTQAHDQAITVEVPTSSEALPLFICSPPILHLPDVLTGFQTRAPPEFA